MKKLFIAALISFSLSSCIGAGNISDIEMNKQGYFPNLTGIDLMGKERPIPSSLEGKYNLLAVAFKREQQANVDTWIKAAPDIIGKNSQVKFYEIPLIYEINTPYRFWINNGMRQGVKGSEARDRTITVYTDREKFLNLMNMKTNNIYLLLIDKKGKIITKIEGDATKNNVKKIKSYIKEKIS